MSRGVVAAAVLVAAAPLLAGVGDPQTRSDHPWYPGELACSTFERLFRTQAELYERAAGRKVASDEDRALASYYWRNLNYFHCTVGREDVWDKGHQGGEATREYWSGLFGYGFGLCFTTHHQWHGEMATLLGRDRARTMGVDGHTSFETYLTGGPYGQGQWVLLDHDVSTVVFTPDGKRLMGLMEVNKDMASVKRSHRERGFIPGGLHPSDPGAYGQVKWAGYATGYAAVPPMVHLRSGETLRRYPAPGLDDGKTFVYWGINYNQKGIPGPARDRTWVNQPEAMYGSGRAAPYNAGQARFANAVYTYKPDFRSGRYKPDFPSGRYKEGVIDESADHVTLEWYSPYVIAATPPEAKAAEKWGIYETGCTNGLVVRGRMTCPVAISTDQGATWQEAGAATDGIDLTDLVKGHRQYWIRFGAGAKALAASGPTLTTVCQCGPTVIPHLKAGTNRVTYEASGRAVVSAGPNLDQAKAHVVDGGMDSPAVTLELAAPRGAKAVGVYAAARVQSGSPPADAAYRIDCSTDGGKTWKPVLEERKIVRRPPEPDDWWSQTFTFADAPLDAFAGPVRVRFTNSANRRYMRAEAHLVYEVANTSLLAITFAWKDAQGKTGKDVHRIRRGQTKASWTFDAGPDPETLWVEYAAQ